MLSNAKKILSENTGLLSIRWEKSVLASVNDDRTGTPNERAELAKNSGYQAARARREQIAATMAEFQLKKQMSELMTELAPFQKVKDFLTLPDFQIEDGTMTPTFKVRRKQVLEKYADQISQFLAANNESV